MFRKNNLGWIFLAMIFLLGTMAASPTFGDDYYKNYADLAAHEKLGKDYLINLKNNNSDTAVIAIHGGKIQSGTSEIAKAIAGENYNCYSFEGVKNSNNYDLFLKAIRFDEPKAVKMVADSKATVSIIGINNTESIVYVGGLDTNHKSIISKNLKYYGFEVKDPIKNDRNDIAGVYTTNICNENKSGAGVQLALSESLRDNLNNDSKSLNNFVDAVRKGLSGITIKNSSNNSGNSGGSNGGGGVTLEDEQVPYAAPIIITDIDGHWAEEQIKNVVAAGIMGLYDNNTFRPGASVTKAEFVTALIKALKLELKEGKVFADTVSHPDKQYISAAAAYGIISTDSDKFNPDEMITRQEMAVMICKAKNVTDYGTGKNFSDASKIAPWAKNAVAWVSGNNIMRGYPDNTFRPTANTTRAEVAMILSKLL